MTLTINLTPEQEEQLADEASRCQLPLEEYAIRKVLGVSLLADGDRTGCLASTAPNISIMQDGDRVKRFEDMQRSLREAGADQSEYAISETALTRDELYAEREGRA